MNLLSAQPSGPAGTRGEIFADSGSPALDCRILNMSAAGATLAVPDGVAVPETITLAIAGEFVMRRCRVVDRRRGRITVAFEMPV
ncbi:PilZ domain-containing protein [Methylobacterium indicum]|uniref:PilZ domain-containing protein n=1 Tax=Methylobacterium indicum TaxID=1775910 RepID=UPI0024355616|nr:PilZ domain-containing protein [Methylobacterium indicum]